MSNLNIITEALRTCFGSASQVAEAAGCSLAAASRYRAGIGVPNVVMLSRLMRKSNGFATSLIEYLGLDDASLDAEAVRLRQDFTALQREVASLNAAYKRFLDAHPQYAAAMALEANPLLGGESQSGDQPR